MDLAKLKLKWICYEYVMRLSKYMTGLVPSVLWHCWLGVRKSIRPVKIKRWGVGVVICLERGADCLHTVQLMLLHPQTPSSLASFKSGLVLPFWYKLTQVVLEKRPLNGCASGSSSSNHHVQNILWHNAIMYCEYIHDTTSEVLTNNVLTQVRISPRAIGN